MSDITKPPRLAITAEQGFGGDVITIPEHYSVRFKTADGRTMFEVHSEDDGASIVVRAVDMTKVGGVLRDALLTIEPRACNTIIVRTTVYHKQPKN